MIKDSTQTLITFFRDSNSTHTSSSQINIKDIYYKYHGFDNDSTNNKINFKPTPKDIVGFGFKPLFLNYDILSMLTIENHFSGFLEYQLLCYK